MELTADEIAAFRANRDRRWSIECSRSGPVIQLVGGPLSGIKAKVTSVMTKSQFIGFCHLYPDRGLVQLIYERQSHARYVFREMSGSFSKKAGYPLERFRDRDAE